MRLSKDEIFFINALHSSTAVSAKDCIIDGRIVSFLVKSSEIGRTIGKNGLNIKKLGKQLNRTVEIIGYYNDPQSFIKNAFNKIGINNIETKDTEKGKKMVLYATAEGKMNILRNKKRFERIKSFANRNYNISELRLR